MCVNEREKNGNEKMSLLFFSFGLKRGGISFARLFAGYIYSLWWMGKDKRQRRRYTDGERERSDIIM